MSQGFPGAKICPTCGKTAVIDAQQCSSCGHVYRTKFPPPQPLNQTIGFPGVPLPGAQPPPGINPQNVVNVDPYAQPLQAPMVQRRSYVGWLIAGAAVIVGTVLFLAWPNVVITMDKGKLVGSWETVNQGSVSGLILKPDGKGTFTLESQVIQDIEWELTRPGFLYLKGQRSNVIEYEFLPGGEMRIGVGDDATIYHRSRQGR